MNLDTIAFRNVLKLARERELIVEPPVVRQLKQKPSPRKPLLTREQFERLLSTIPAATVKNGVLLRFYLRFLALTGAREQETLAVRWADVDFTREIVTIGAGGVAKNHRERDVDFSPELRALLHEMEAAHPPDSSWLFPSPLR